jgi:hypothetical protein
VLPTIGRILLRIEVVLHTYNICIQAPPVNVPGTAPCLTFDMSARSMEG